MIKQGSFRDFIIQYLKVTVLVYVAFSILFFSFVYLTQNKQEQEKLDLCLASSASYLESISNILSSVNLTLLSDKSISQIMNSPFTVDRYEYVRGMQTINSQAGSSDVISSIYIYQKRSGEVLATKEGKYLIDSFHDQEFLRELEVISSTFIIPRVSNGKSIITLVSPWILSSYDIKGYICINLDAIELNKRLSQIMGKKYSLQATTGEQVFLTYNPSGNNLDVNKNFSRSKNLEHFNISISVMREKSKFYQQLLVTFLRDSIFLLLFVVLVSLVFYLLLRSLVKAFRPLVYKLATLYREKERHMGYTINDLRNDFNQLITDRQVLFDSVDRMKWIAKRKIVTDLLYGTIPDKKEFQFFCNSFDILNQTLQNFFAISYISLYGKESILSTEDKVLGEVVIQDIFMDGNPKEVTICPVLDNDGNIGVLLNYQKSMPQYEIEALIKTKIEKIEQALKANPNIGFFVCTINSVDSIEKIHLAYSQAKDNLIYRNVFLNRNHIFDTLDDESLKLLSYADMQMMISAANSDDFNAVHQYIKSLEEDYKKNKNQEEFYKLKLSALIAASIILGQTYLSNNLDIQKKILDVLKQIVSSEDNKKIANDFIKLTNLISRQRIFRMPEGAMGSDYLQQLVSFVEVNYDKGITVAEVANYLNLNPKYLARLFKQETGQTISEYISRLRIEKGLSLLNQTDLSIQEISSQIGFSDSRSFIRLFKKTFDMTPGEYRKEINTTP
ncbi:MAG: AraC family transcriptional regulator [Caldicoprobacterales bacterium]|nr:helix-turn-helix transcriptional regulator [Clostridiales bacterium]